MGLRRELGEKLINIGQLPTFSDDYSEQMPYPLIMDVVMARFGRIIAGAGRLLLDSANSEIGV